MHLLVKPKKYKWEPRNILLWTFSEIQMTVILTNGVSLLGLTMGGSSWEPVWDFFNTMVRFRFWAAHLALEIPNFAALFITDVCIHEFNNFNSYDRWSCKYLGKTNENNDNQTGTNTTRYDFAFKRIVPPTNFVFLEPAGINVSWFQVHDQNQLLPILFHSVYESHMLLELRKIEYGRKWFKYEILKV